jgi:hypothetical protein
MAIVRVATSAYLEGGAIERGELDHEDLFMRRLGCTESHETLRPENTRVFPSL